MAAAKSFPSRSTRRSWIRRTSRCSRIVLSGVQQAIEDAKKVASAEMGKLTAGLNIPGLSL